MNSCDVKQCKFNYEGSLTGVNTSEYPNVAPPMSTMSRSMMLGPNNVAVQNVAASQRQRHAHRYRDEIDASTNFQQQQHLLFQNQATAAHYQYPGDNHLRSKLLFELTMIQR
jgi:hypothetical protein